MIIPLLLALPSLQGAPELLPPLREGWRFERLELPLSFAPDLDHEGFEELEFAPGMFDPESPSYFSYALCFELEEALELDEAFVERFFTTYFRGLCATVGASRNLELDVSRVSVEADAGPHFIATVRMFDAFVTGEPLVLRLELERAQSPGPTRFLGLASPADRDAPIWRELEAIRTDWRAKHAMPVYLNHFYFVPDADTYAAIKGSEFLTGGFAPWEERTTVRKDMSYTGIYFYGQNTYFEFLHPDSGFPVGSIGIAFGVEEPGGTALLERALEERGIRSFARPVTRELAGEQVPWFDMLGIEAASATSPLQLFSLEYNPGFLDRWHADLAPQGHGIGRSRILERYAAALGQGDLRTQSPLEDVNTIILRLDEADSGRMREVGRALGFKVSKNPDNTTFPVDGWTCDAPGLDIVWHVVREGGSHMYAVLLGLRETIERDPIDCGNVVFAFDELEARMLFRRPGIPQRPEMEEPPK